MASTIDKDVVIKIGDKKEKVSLFNDSIVAKVSENGYSVEFNPPIIINSGDTIQINSAPYHYGVDFGTSGGIIFDNTSGNPTVKGDINFDTPANLKHNPGWKMMMRFASKPNVNYITYRYDPAHEVHNMKFRYSDGTTECKTVSDELIKSMSEAKMATNIPGGWTVVEGNEYPSMEIPLDNSTQLIKKALENKTRADAKNWLRKTLMWFYKERQTEPKDAWEYIINVFRAYWTGKFVGTNEAKRLHELFEPKQEELPF